MNKKYYRLDNILKLNAVHNMIISKRSSGKAFYIINKKRVNVMDIKANEYDLEYYNKTHSEKYQLTKEEYELLKEVLCNE